MKAVYGPVNKQTNKQTCFCSPDKRRLDPYATFKTSPVAGDVMDDAWGAGVGAAGAAMHSSSQGDSAPMVVRQQEYPSHDAGTASGAYGQAASTSTPARPPARYATPSSLRGRRQRRTEHVNADTCSIVCNHDEPNDMLRACVSPLLSSRLL